MKNRLFFYIYVVLSFSIISLCFSNLSLAQSAIDSATGYREFPIIGSRVAVWIVAQIHLNFAAFILGVPIFAVLMELIGIITKKPQYDRMAKEFTKLTLMALTTTSIFGALLVFLFLSLYPGFFGFLTNIFAPTFWIYPILFFGETICLYLYWYTWDEFTKRKVVHLFIGILLNVFGITIMFVANSWVSFMTSPAGIDEQGNLLSLWEAATNFTWMPLNIHRFIGNISFGGAVVAAYAGFKFMVSKTDAERAHYDWMGYTGNIIAISAFMLLPFAGYWLTKEIYTFSEQLGVILMGGFLSWLWIIQALIIGILFLATNCYFWMGMERIPGSERYKKYTKYLFIIVALCFLVWATPHTLIATQEETHRMGGSHHPTVGVLGLMSAKNTAVDIMILATFISFILYRRGNKIPTVKWARFGIRTQKLLILAASGVVIFYGIYGYFVEAVVRVGFSVFQVASILICILSVTVIDIFLFRKSKIIGEIRWGKIPFRSQYTLLAIGVTYTWLMGLMGFARSAIRQHWHVYGILKDTSPHAYTPTLGYTANMVSIITILFISFILFIFWISGLGDKKKRDNEGKVPEGKGKGQNPKMVLFKGMLFSVALISFFTIYANKIPQIESRVPEEIVISEGGLTQEEMIRIGNEIFEGKGNCSVCHTEGGGRGPDMEHIGLTAETRVPDMSSEVYLMESLIKPTAYVVKGFGPIMPPANKSPVSLNQTELLSVIAYMQSLGGIVTITPDDIQEETSTAPATPPTPVEKAKPKEDYIKIENEEVESNKVGSKETLVPEDTHLIEDIAVPISGDINEGVRLFEEKGCSICHVITAEEEADLAPNLFGIGERAKVEYIRESIIDPEARVIEGFDLSMPPYGEEELTTKELEDVLVYLQSLKG